MARQKKEPQEVVIPSNPADLAVILAELEEISDILTLIELKKENIKDIISGVCEAYVLPRKLVNKMASAHHKLNMNDIIADTDDLVNLYEAVINNAKGANDE